MCCSVGGPPFQPWELRQLLFIRIFISVHLELLLSIHHYVRQRKCDINYVSRLAFRGRTRSHGDSDSLLIRLQKFRELFPIDYKKKTNKPNGRKTNKQANKSKTKNTNNSTKHKQLKQSVQKKRRYSKAFAMIHLSSIAPSLSQSILW